MTTLVKVKLTPLESLVYDEIINTGDCAKLIAKRISMTVAQVKKHTGNILRHYNIDKQSQLIVQHYKGVSNEG